MRKITFLFIFIINLIGCYVFSFGVFANELSVIKYGYGIREWDGDKYIDARIHPKLWYQGNELNVRFKLAEDNIFRERQLYGITTALTAEHSSGDVIAILSFQNKSTSSYFIRNASLPYSPEKYNIRDDFSDDNKPCRMLFFIATDNVLLDYLGDQCDLRSSSYEEDWIEFPPGKRMEFKIKLNDDYEFMKGVNVYSIKSASFTFVRKQWIIGDNTNKNLLNILDVCEWLGIYSLDYLLPFKGDFYCKKNSFSDFVQKFGFDGNDYGNMFIVSSNQVNVKLNGDEIKSLYKRQ